MLSKDAHNITLYNYLDSSTTMAKYGLKSKTGMQHALRFALPTKIGEVD